MGYFYDRYVENSLVGENPFLTAGMEESELPSRDKAFSLLPSPYWEGNDGAIRCYWKTWELALRGLRKPTRENGFVSNYISTCFNDCLFMWDSVIALMYGKYGRNAFPFQQTLDNIYAKQHPDGFMCREISETDGTDRFHRFDPSSTGPNILAWSEWEHFSLTGDTARLSAVFPVLVAYHRWFMAYRTWPDGTYWSSGWGTGLDNQPRLKEGQSQEFYHGHMSWIDTCAQAVFSAKCILKIAAALSRENEVKDLEEEIASLTNALNTRFWNEQDKYYYDVYANGEQSKAKTIGAYWALLADVVPGEGLSGFVGHLDDRKTFNRPHRVPSLPADNPLYNEYGNYWCGGVWVFTNYMLLRGLTERGRHCLAHDIALNHLENVVKVYEATDTIWENYSPEHIAPGKPAKPDFVGAGGISPIAVLFEYVFGLRPGTQGKKLVWDVRRLEAHGVEKYPFGQNGMIDLRCGSRTSAEEEPRITVKTNAPLEIELIWNNGANTKSITF